ncbi:hypothetical protein L596_026689 [Steinernema carpocapsae]|nr:hypothetical protein L596_026689 [Steinernema carpocapsae]
MSVVWCVLAPMAMISAFINESDKSHCDSNLTDCYPTVSIRSEFELYGEYASLPATSVSVAIIGDIFGGFVLSSLSDHYGRKPTVCIACLCLGIFGLFSAFAPNIYAYIGIKFVQGLFSSGLLVNWVLSYESIPHSIRAYTSIVFGTAWVIGYCALAPICYHFQHWRPIKIVTSIPPLAAGVFIWLTIPESFHFVVSQRKLPKIDQWMRKVERYGKNKLTIAPGKLLEDMEKTHPKKDNDGKSKISAFYDDIKELASNRTVLRDIGIIAYVWVCNGFVYYALSLMSTTLAGNRYVNFVLLGLVELPAYFVAPYLLDNVGRRLVVAVCQGIIGVSMLSIIFVPTNSSYMTLAIWLIAKAAVSGSFNSIFIYGSEVFPTNHRNLCIAMCSISSKFLTIFAPHIGTLSAFDPRLPMILYGFLGITSGLLTLFLPETLNKPLPSDLNDVQK